MTQVSRGFHRIGIALALPVLAVATALILLTRHKARLLPVYPTLLGFRAKPIARGQPCRAPYNMGAMSELRRRGDDVDVGTATGLAIALYMGCRTLGWISDGFRGTT